MTPTQGLQQWRNDLQRDIELILRAGIRPLAIVRRLTEAQLGVPNPHSDWYHFCIPVRGISQQVIDLGAHFVTLDFRHYGAAKKVWEELTALKDDYKVIAAIDVRAHKPRDHGSISISFPVFAG